ncbi:exopolysaccharide biosynthesis protein [Rickettsiales bacterium]|nr:exopolysaccharide biosynthesis protein [Rickettsiales bacterium]
MRKKLTGKLQKPTADLLEDVVVNNTSDMIYIKDIINNMNQGGFALIMLIFSLPILVPLPPPLPSFIAFPLLVFSFQMMTGFNAPKIPKFIGNRQIKRQLLAKIIEKSVFQLRKSEKFIKSRWSFIFDIFSETIIGFLSFIFALSILVPLPLTNLLPGISILIISLSLLSKDGLILLFGLFVGISGILITSAILIFGVGIIVIAKNYIINFF